MGTVLGSHRTQPFFCKGRRSECSRRPVVKPRLEKGCGGLPAQQPRPVRVWTSAVGWALRPLGGPPSSLVPFLARPPQREPLGQQGRVGLGGDSPRATPCPLGRDAGISSGASASAAPGRRPAGPLRPVAFALQSAGGKYPSTTGEDFFGVGVNDSRVHSADSYPGPPVWGSEGCVYAGSCLGANTQPSSLVPSAAPRHFSSSRG